MAEDHPVVRALRERSIGGSVVVAHRGDSSNFPENTVPAFAAAHRLGVIMQEFDVRAARDGTLVCLHDATFDRTTDAPERLGPGALVAQATLAEVKTLDAGRWFGAGHSGTPIPTLVEALDTMLPQCIPMIEHKAGDAQAFVEALRHANAVRHCLLQSFDWDFVAAAKRAEPGLAVALLGPTDRFRRPDEGALAIAAQVGAAMIHWHDSELDREDVERVHGAGLLVCTYTTDDDAGFAGGAALGFDAMCTNRPERMLRLAADGCLRRLEPRRLGTH
jgi:glycerophosphoryl diester phosphodiesterase